jgi:hypothetical protein
VDEVVLDLDQLPVVVLQAQQPPADQRRPGEVERDLGRLGEDPLGEVPPLGLRHVPEVEHRQVNRSGRMNDLGRLSVHHREAGAQHFVPADDLVERPMEDREVERPADPDRDLEVVGDVAASGELVEKPDPLLREGERDRAVARGAPDRGELGQPGAGGALPLGLLDGLGERGHRRLLEHLHQRQLDREDLAHPGGQLGHHQRVAAELEEIVVDADPLDPQQLAPDSRQDLLDRIARRGVARVELRTGGVRGRQRPAVHLAAGGERQRLEEHERRRQHVLGQGLLERRSQPAGLDRAGRGRHHPGGQPLLAGGAMHRDHRVAHAVDAAQGRLDLAELDAEAADLHLMIGAAAELQRAVLQQADEIAGAVEPLARGRSILRYERIGHEALGGEVGPAQVAAGETGAADIELAVHPPRQQLHAPVQHADPGIRHGMADRQPGGGHRRRGGQVELGGDDRRLGRTVGVDQPDPLRHSPAPGGEPFSERLLAADDDQAEGRGKVEPLGVDLDRQLVPVGGGQVERGDPQPFQGAHEPVEGADHGVVAEHQRATGGQAGVDLLGAGVEADRGELEDAVGGTDPVLRHGAADVVDERGVRDQDPLGPARRAGGVDHVGRALRQRRAISRHPLAGRDRRPVGIEAHHPRRGLRQAVGQALLGEQHAHPGILEHQRHALARVVGIQRQIGGAGLERAEHADQHLGRALHDEADDRLRPHSQPPQVAGQPRGARLQLGVGEALVPLFHRDRFRRAGRGRGDQVVDAGVAGLAGARAGTGRQQLAPLGWGEHRQLAETRVGVGDHGGEQAGQSLQQAASARRREAGPVIRELQLESPLLGDTEEGEHVVVGLGEARLPDLEAQVTAPGQAVYWIVLEHQQGFEDAHPVLDLAPGLDLLERAVLVLPLLDLLPLQLREPGPQPLRGIDPQPYRQGVDEHPHDRLDAGHLGGPARDHAAEQHVVGPGVVAEEETPGALQERVESHLVVAGELLETAGGLRPEIESLVVGRPADDLAAGARAVERHRRGRREAGQRPAPERLGIGDVLELKPVDEGAVGARGLEPGLGPLGEGPVDGEHLREEDRHRPAVHDDVAEAPDELADVRRPADHGDPDQGGLAEIETLVVVFAQEGGEPFFPFRFGQPAPVDLLPGQLDIPAHDLQRLIPPLPEEHSPESGVPVDGPLPRLPPSREVEAPFQRGHILIEVDLRGVAGQQQIEEHALL